MFTPILVVLNVLGAIVAVIWLAFSGEWGAIGMGLLACIGGPFIISLPMLVSMVFVLPAGHFIERGNTVLAYPFIFLSLSVTYIVMFAWFMGIFSYFLSNGGDDLIPILLWSYTVASGPWQYMAQKEQNPYGAMSVFYGQLGFAATLALFFFGVDFEQASLALVISLVLCAIIQFSMGIENQNLKEEFQLK